MSLCPLVSLLKDLLVFPELLPPSFYTFHFYANEIHKKGKGKGLLLMFSGF